MKDKDTLFNKIYNNELVSKLQCKIDLLGVEDRKFDAITFLNMRIITSILVYVLIFSNFKYGYVFGLIITILYFFLFEKVLIDDKLKARERKLNNEAIYFFEVLTLSLQTGRNLAEAIMITTNAVDNELSKMFKEALRETKFGKSLAESLTDMQRKIPSDSINNIILNLTQANISGSSIVDAMHSHIDYLNERKKMEVKTAISKIPTKISVISVFFFIPLILLIILGPVLLNYIG